VLFEGERVSGIIDFGFAATDFLAYDLAITVNDWCIARPDSGALVPELVTALVGAYDAVRPLTPDERAQWAGAAARRGAALLALPASTTCTCPARASSCTRTTPATSNAFCAIGSTTVPACRVWPTATPERSQDHEFSAACDRLRALLGTRGAAWLKDAAAMLAAARVPWLMLLLAYYLIQLLVSVIPLAGRSR